MNPMRYQIRASFSAVGFTFLLGGTVSISSEAFAQTYYPPVQYLSLKTTDVETPQKMCFVFADAGTTMCYRQISEKPFVLRKDGGWGPSWKSVSKGYTLDQLNVLDDYRDLTIRRVGLNEDAQFVAQLEFNIGLRDQTEFVFGDAQSGRVYLTSYADLNPQQIKRRLLMKAFGSLMNPDQNVQLSPELVSNDDHRRIYLVAPIVNQVLETRAIQLSALVAHEH